MSRLTAPTGRRDARAGEVSGHRTQARTPEPIRQQETSLVQGIGRPATADPALACDEGHPPALHAKGVRVAHVGGKQRAQHAAQRARQVQRAKGLAAAERCTWHKRGRTDQCRAGASPGQHNASARAAAICASAELSASSERAASAPACAPPPPPTHLRSSLL